MFTRVLLNVTVKKTVVLAYLVPKSDVTIKSMLDLTISVFLRLSKFRYDDQQ
jgi:hypothetical protein